MAFSMGDIGFLELTLCGFDLKNILTVDGSTADAAFDEVLELCETSYKIR